MIHNFIVNYSSQLWLTRFVNSKGRCGIVREDDFEVFHECGAQVPRFLITVNGLENRHIACVFLIETKSFPVDKKISVFDLENLIVYGNFEGSVNVVDILALSLEFTEI